MKILNYLKEYESSQKTTINLVASENLLCMDARVPYLSDSISRYTFDEDVDLFFPGREILTKIENECCDLISELLNAKHINIKPISGLNCMMALIGSLTKIDDVIYSVSPVNGGHGATKPLAERLGLTHKFLPYNREAMDIDFDFLESQLQENHKIKMVYLDFMNILFPIDVKRLREVLPKRTIIVFDASHLMGLIFGKQFENPLNQGADFLIGSTHKTLPGPHKGIVATNSAIYNKIFNHMQSLYISHHHIGDVASLGISLEKYKNIFPHYAKQVLENSFNLANRLHSSGLNVQFKDKQFTSTHQIWIDVGEKSDVQEFVKKLSESGIIVNSMDLPNLDNEYGIRIGVQEITMKGFKKREIDTLSDIISDIYHDNKNVLSAKERVFKLVSTLDDEYENSSVTKIDEFLKGMNNAKEGGE